MALGAVIQVLNLTQVFEHAPAWVWVLVWAVQLLVVLPAVIAYAAVIVRDARSRRRDRESR
jgi:hypothetical protein